MTKTQLDRTLEHAASKIGWLKDRGCWVSEDREDFEAVRKYCTETGPALLVACKSALEHIENGSIAMEEAVIHLALKAAIANAEGE